MKENHCIFCKLAAGEIPSNTLYEDEDFRVIMDISPAVKGHAIVLPKQHMQDLLTINSETAKKALFVVSKAANAVKAALGCDGINILQNNGEAAGQSVFHLHFHILPRYHGDHFSIPWEPLSYEEGEAEATAEKIRAKLS